MSSTNSNFSKIGSLKKVGQLFFISCKGCNTFTTFLVRSLGCVSSLQSHRLASPLSWRSHGSPAFLLYGCQWVAISACSGTNFLVEFLVASLIWYHQKMSWQNLTASALCSYVNIHSSILFINYYLIEFGEKAGLDKGRY